MTPDEQYRAAGLVSVAAASVKKADKVWFLGALHEVERVEHGTPEDGKITWSLEGIDYPVTVSATRRVGIARS